MSSDTNSAGLGQDLGGYVEAGGGGWAEQQSQYEGAEPWLYFDPMFATSPNGGAVQGGYSDETSKLSFTDGNEHPSWDTFGGGGGVLPPPPAAVLSDVKQSPTDPAALDSIFTTYTDSRRMERRKVERRRPRRAAANTTTSASNNTATYNSPSSWGSSRRAVGNKSFSNSLNRFTHPDENGKRKIRNEIMSIAESLPALPGLYFDKKQKGFRVRYQNVYVGWVALSRFASIEEAYISAREIWESAKCHAEKFQTPHAAVMASYPLQKEAQASGKNRGGRPRTVTQLPPDPANWLNTAFLAHQPSAAVPLSTPWGEPPPPPPDGYPNEKRRCRSPPQQQPYWPPWPTENFVLTGGDQRADGDCGDPDNFWTQQSIPFGHTLKAQNADSSASFPGSGYSHTQPSYHLQECILTDRAGRDYRSLCHPPDSEAGFDDPRVPAEYCALGPFMEQPGAISFSQPVAEEVLPPRDDIRPSSPPPIVKRETESPPAPLPRKRRRRESEDDLSPPPGDDEDDLRPPSAKRRYFGTKIDGVAVSASPPPSSDASTALPPVPHSPPSRTN